MPKRFLLTATVCDIEPAIWRQVDVAGGLKLGDLHILLQICFDWQDQHLHVFSERFPYAPGPPGRSWGPAPWEDDDGDTLPEFETTMQDLLPGLDGPLFYQYDFGDSWLVALTAEPSASEADCPAVVTDGARSGPLEDSGGVPGYYELVETLADPRHERHSELQMWMADVRGDDFTFDPDHFDKDTINEHLSGALR